MALWRISVKSSGTVNGIRLALRSNVTENKPKINNLFVSKYGVDLLKAGLISPTHLQSEKIS